MSARIRIAVLGATGHIAKNLIVRFLEDPRYELRLFARDRASLKVFIDMAGKRPCPPMLGFEDFPGCEYDAIVNCVGIGDPIRQGAAGVDLFLLAERFDNMVVEYLKGHRDASYICFSSGAIYGSDFNECATEETIAAFAVNRIPPEDYYRIAKLNSEAKHRAMSDSKIIDLRVFGFFSRFMDTSAGFLLAEMVRAVRSGTEFSTNKEDIVRDFVSPDDLYRLVAACISSRGVNGAFDVYSRIPARKSELISLFIERYGMRLRYREDNTSISATGIKRNYYSLDRKAASLGYGPQYSSIEAVTAEADALLRGRDK